MLAPPWIAVPPPGYGGIEQVIALLTDELTARGNDVTLFAAPGTRSDARVRSPLEGTHPDEIQLALYEVDHVASAFASIEEADGPSSHDNCGFAAFAFADRIDIPLVLLHGPFTEDHGLPRPPRVQAPAVALSRYQADQAPPSWTWS